MAVLISFIVYGTVIASLIAYGLFVYSRRNMYKHAATIPKALAQLPLIGNAHQFAGTTTVITDPASAEIVLNTAMEKDSVYRFMKPWLGNGLVSGSVPIWKKHRKMLLPTFNQRLLNGFIDVFANQCNILITKLEDKIGTGQFDVFKYISSCTLDIICETAMGVKVNAQGNTNNSYIQAGIGEMQLICKRMYQIWLQPQWLFNLTKYAKIEKENIKILHDFTKAVVRKKRFDFERKKEAIHRGEIFEENQSGCKAFLDMMIELSNGENKLTDDELREEVDTMTIAGNDTSALASSYVLIMLGCHPHIQDKVIDELREIYGDSKRPVVKEDLPKMPYLERVIKETLRLFPVAPVVVRNLTQDVKLDKYTLPAGAGCVIAVYGMHRQESVWGENPNDFNPDHFLPENVAKRHPYSYIPFSAGPRNCIGKQYAMMSMKSLLSTILRTYRIHSNVDYKTIELKSEILLKPLNGHLISIERRLKL
ncbi:cytochrome P450 4C1-like isoform X2 [Arctopsyche grandis]|uniref:cytochrome P450 4C1-like isoform X2 n=1 Tax=Arctopsyche grandis TaxID=121162 RepID=UPI00406D74FF